jgi:phosphonate transport system substrate-binding protein
VVWLGWLLTLSLPVTAAPGPGSEPRVSEHLVFGFLPIISSEQLVQRFSPLTGYLSAQLGIPVRMETAPDFETFVQRTHRQQRYDILFTAPHLYYLAQHNAGYRALVRVDRPGMKAVIVAPLRNRISTLDQLRGKRLATTDPMALATVLVKRLLMDSGLRPGRDLTLVATPSHNASLLSSHRGATDASALILPLFRRARPEIRAAMQIVAETRSVPHMPIAVAPWLPAASAERLQHVLLGLSGNAAGRTLLAGLGWPGLTPVAANEYEPLKPFAEQVGVD